MPEPGYVLAAILTAAAVTWMLRALPFALVKPLRRSALLPYLAAYLPVGVMGILMVYTLRHIRLSDVRSVVPVAVALTVTVLLHLWRRSAILSVLAGTAVNVALIAMLKP